MSVSVCETSVIENCNYIRCTYTAVHEWTEYVTVYTMLLRALPACLGIKTTLYL